MEKLVDYFSRLFGEPESQVMEFTSGDYTALIAGFGGAVLGAVISGLISYIIANKYHKIQIEIEKKSREDALKVDAITLTVKVNRILDSLYSAKKTIDGLLAEHHENDQLRLWEKFKPVLGLPNHPVIIDDESLTALIAAKQSDVTSKVLHLSSKWESLLGTIKSYFQERNEFMEVLMENSVEVGDHFIVSGDKVPILKTRGEALDKLAASIIKYLDKDLQSGLKVAEEMGSAFRKRFNDPEFPVLKVTDLENQQGKQEELVAQNDPKFVEPSQASQVSLSEHWPYSYQASWSPLDRE